MPESQDWNGLWNVPNPIPHPQYRSPVRKPNDPVYSQFITSTGYELTISWENLVLSRKTALFPNSFPSTSYFQKMLLKKRVKQCHKLYPPSSLEAFFKALRNPAVRKKAAEEGVVFVEPKALSKIIWRKQTNNNYNQNKQAKSAIDNLAEFLFLPVWYHFGTSSMVWSFLIWLVVHELLFFEIMPIWPFRFIWVQIVLSSF